MRLGEKAPRLRNGGVSDCLLKRFIQRGERWLEFKVGLLRCAVLRFTALCCSAVLSIACTHLRGTCSCTTWAAPVLHRTALRPSQPAAQLNGCPNRAQGPNQPTQPISSTH